MNSFSTAFKRRAINAVDRDFLRAGDFVRDRIAHLQRAQRQSRTALRKSLAAKVERLSIRGVENAGKISDFLYRGAKPRGAGYDELKKLEISIVVDLRNSKPPSVDTKRHDGGETREQGKVEAAGMRSVEIPTRAFFGPTESQVAVFLQIAARQPKTEGLRALLFRNRRDGGEAYNEMRAYHFHKHLIFMGHFVKFFPAEFALSPVFATLRQEPGANRSGVVADTIALACISFF